MTTLLLAYLLVFRSLPPEPQPLAVGQHVWVLGVNELGQEINQDWGTVTAIDEGCITVHGQRLDWFCKRWGVRRIGGR